MIMEKLKPHSSLERVRAFIELGQVSATKTALDSAEGLGFDLSGMIAVVQALEMRDFYKSMTTHDDHRVWQDVNHATTTHGEVYLKLTVIDDLLIVSFKEL